MKVLARTVLIAVPLLALAACSSNEVVESGEGLSVSDTWVKAADKDMTSAFGTITNAGGDPVVIISVSSPASGSVELHETVMGADGEMSMQEISHGFTIDAGGDLQLEPGGNHLMLMDIHEPIEAGEMVSFVATLDDGSTFEFEAVAKEYTGANESYHDDH